MTRLLQSWRLSNSAGLVPLYRMSAEVGAERSTTLAPVLDKVVTALVSRSDQRCCHAASHGHTPLPSTLTGRTPTQPPNRTIPTSGRSRLTIAGQSGLQLRMSALNGSS